MCRVRGLLRLCRRAKVGAVSRNITAYELVLLRRRSGQLSRHLACCCQSISKKLIWRLNLHGVLLLQTPYSGWMQSGPKRY